MSPLWTLVKPLTPFPQHSLENLAFYDLDKCTAPCPKHCLDGQGRAVENEVTSCWLLDISDAARARFRGQSCSISFSIIL